MKTKPLAGSQTPARRKAYEAFLRDRETGKRMFHNMLGFWRVCGKPLCRRNRACTGDVDACFQRFWPLVPEETKEYVRGCIRAAQHTRDPQEIGRAGMAAHDACLKRLAKTRRRRSRRMRRSRPERQSAPDVRVRRL